MSYDIYVRDDGDGSRWVRNITSNLGAFFAWAIHGTDPERNPGRICDSAQAVLQGKEYRDGLQGLEGLTLEQAEPLLRAAVAKVEAGKREFLERFNADNGWGTWDGGGLPTLRAMLRVCEDAGASKADLTFHISY